MEGQSGDFEGKLGVVVRVLGGAGEDSEVGV